MAFDAGLGFKNIQRKIARVSPFTKWPLGALVLGLYDENKVFVLDYDQLRKDKNTAGQEVYVFKKTGEELIPPQPGLEDARGTVILVQVGDGDYKFAKGIHFDDDSKNIFVTLHDDEQMKFLYAQQIMGVAQRFQPEQPWYTKGIIYLIVLAVATVLITLIWMGEAHALQEQLSGLYEALGKNTAMLERVAPAIGAPPV